MADKEVTIKIGTDVELGEVQALEDNIKRMKKEKIMLDIQANTERLEAIDSEIESVEAKLKSLKAKPDVDDSEILKAEKELEALESEKINVAIAVEDSKLKAAEAEIEDLDGTEINIDANMSMQNISQGIQQAKQGLSELKAGMDEVSQAGMQSEQNLAFLELNLGAEKARDTMQQISDIVAKMPGDDNTMRSVLSTAQALGNNLKPEEMEAATKTMADYMAGSATMGKMATESQQDIMKYLLDGNTAELERGSIVSAYVDKLKDANTFQERQAAMQQVLNDLGYGGISQVDTMLNKQAEWDGMIYNSQDKLSSMWLTAEKGAMDYIIKLNDATDGLVGMGIVAAQMVGGPLVDITTGLGQIATGFKSLKDAANFVGLTEKLSGLKTALIGVASTAKSTALSLLEVGKNALIAGYNALKSAALWAYQKLALIASTVAEYGLAAAQALLNVVMSMNPIMLVVIALVALAAALVWAYYNVDWFRQMVDGAWQSLVQLGQQIYGAVAGALQWLGDLFNQFTSQLGLNTNNWIQAVLGFILFLPTLPLQAAIVFADMIAKALGFGNNFTSTMINGAIRAVVGFVNKIKEGVQQFASAVQGIPNALQQCLDWAYNMVMSHPIVQALKWLGEQAVNAFSILGLGQGSPGDIYGALQNELNWSQDMVKDSKLPKTTAKLGSDMANSFSPAFDVDGMSLSNGSIDRAVNTFGRGGDIIINIEGDVDSEARINQIVEVIRRELAWNNTTAGRTI